MNLPNLAHFLVSNRRYGATSNAALPNQKVNDYAAIARAMGLERVFDFDNLRDLERGFDAAVLANAPGHTFVVLEVEPFTRRRAEDRAAAVRRAGAEVPLRARSRAPRRR